MNNEKIIETQNAQIIDRATECERCAELEKEIESLYSWRGLMKILDKVYPEWLFTTAGVKITEDNYTSVGDIGAVVVNMIRKVDELEKANNWHKIESESDLPTENERVLLTYLNNGKEVSRGYYFLSRARTNDLVCWIVEGAQSVSNDQVIAWMPLPEPFED